MTYVAFICSPFSANDSVTLGTLKFKCSVERKGDAPRRFQTGDSHSCKCPAPV